MKNTNWDLFSQKTEYFTDNDYDMPALLRRMAEWFEVTNAAPVFIHITDIETYVCAFVGHSGEVATPYLDRRPQEKKEIFWAKETAMNELIRSVLRKMSSELADPSSSYDAELEYCDDHIIEAARQLTGSIANNDE